MRDQLRRRGLHREALQAEPKVFGRYEAARTNDRSITDVLVGPWVPHPKVDASVRAKMFLIVDDHSRLLVDGVFYSYENARACQETLRRAIVRRGTPEVLYADNGPLSATPGWPAPAPCWGSGWSTPSPTRPKAGASRRG